MQDLNPFGPLHFHLLVLYSDLGLILLLFCVCGVRFTAFFSAGNCAPRQRVFCFVTTRAHLTRAQQRLKGALVLKDKRIANLTCSQPVGQLCQLQTCLQWPGRIISENGQRVEAVAEAAVERRRARPLLWVQARAGVAAPAVRPGPWRILLRVPSVPKDKCQRRARPHTNVRTLPRAHRLQRHFFFLFVFFFFLKFSGSSAHMFLLPCMCCILCMLCSAAMSKAAVSASPPPSSS